MISVVPLFEFQIKRNIVTKQKALNKQAGIEARKFASKGLLKQYAACRQKCMVLKKRIQQVGKSRGMAAARKQIK